MGIATVHAKKLVKPKELANQSIQSQPYGCHALGWGGAQVDLVDGPGVELSSVDGEESEEEDDPEVGSGAEAPASLAAARRLFALNPDASGASMSVCRSQETQESEWCRHIVHQLLLRCNEE